MKKYLIWIALGWLVGAPRGVAQLTVWPGDVNNNGVVTNVDFLSLGLAYNFFGPQRAEVNSDFEAQEATPWGFSFSNGVNFAYADCNGDGLINYIYDAFPIYVHYGMTHGSVTPDVFTNGLSGIDPPLYLDSAGVSGPVGPGASVSLPIMLGSAEMPLEDFYGLAFSIEVDPVVIDVDQMMADFSGLNWANPDNDRIYTQYRASNSRIDVAWVRTDRNNQSGFGKIGTLDFIVIDDVVSIQQPATQVILHSVKAIDRFGNETLLSPDTLTIPLDQSSPVGPEPRAPEIEVKISPNPACEYIYLQCNEPIQVANLYDVTGRPVATITPEAAGYFWSISFLPPGVYTCRVQTRSGEERTRIVVCRFD